MLLQRIEAYLRQSRMPPTRFGRDALGDPNFLFNLRDGREPRPATVRRVLAFMESHAPDGSNPGAGR
ncbi:hypothetical protein [Sphingosinicella terrae]|uniref:hypothetical protein n=1 Tax=Sphingosinicella terrae TaxID=2172047 RepID=UPI000E0DC59E|nr:hypothetical protein [Sphingosinicella terrae]